MVQPVAEDLHWIQIEDFVEIFNRLYIVTDLTFEKKGICRRFNSRWLPGDFIAGSGGPPIVIKKELIEEDEEEEEEDEDEEGEREEKIKEPKPPQYQKFPVVNDAFTDNPMYPFAVTESTTMVITLFQLDKRWNSTGRFGQDPTKVLASNFLSRKDRLEAVMKYPIGLGFILARLSGLKIRLTDFRLKKIAHTSEFISFSNSISVVVSLFPGRYAIIPFTHSNLDAQMDYSLHCQFYSSHIEFEIDDVIQQRLQDKEPSDDGNEGGAGEEEDEPEDNDLLMIHNHERSDEHLSEHMEEVLLLNSPQKNFIQKTSVLDKNIYQTDTPKPMNNNNNNNLNASASLTQHQNTQSRIDYENDHVHILTDNVSLLSYEKMKSHHHRNNEDNDNESVMSSSQQEGAHRPLVPLPKLFFHPLWEFQEDMEELSMNHLYLEVNEMMKYVKTLKTEIRKLHGTMKATSSSHPNNENEHHENKRNHHPSKERK
jgi:hypothetical protein